METKISPKIEREFPEAYSKSRQQLYNCLLSEYVPAKEVVLSRKSK